MNNHISKNTKNISELTAEQIESWLDGELPEDEAKILDQLALEDPTLQERRRTHTAMRSLLTREISAQPDLPYADFFMHQLQRRIEEEQFIAESATQEKQISPESKSSSKQWLKWLPWSLSGACATALAVVISLPNTSSSSSDNPVIVKNAETTPVLLSAYSPRAQIRTEADQTQAVIVVLEGLPEYEGEIRGVGLRLSEVEANQTQEQDWSVASQDLY